MTVFKSKLTKKVGAILFVIALAWSVLTGSATFSAGVDAATSTTIIADGGCSTTGPCPGP